MPLVNVQHKPVTGKARQFDGIGAFTDIVSGRPITGGFAQLGYDAAGAVATLRVSGPQYGDITLNLGDWAVFPTDTTLKAMAVTAAAAAADWQTVP